RPARRTATASGTEPSAPRTCAPSTAASAGTDPPSGATATPAPSAGRSGTPASTAALPLQRAWPRIPQGCTPARVPAPPELLRDRLPHPPAAATTRPPPLGAGRPRLRAGERLRPHHQRGDRPLRRATRGR